MFAGLPLRPTLEDLVRAGVAVLATPAPAGQQPAQPLEAAGDPAPARGTGHVEAGPQPPATGPTAEPEAPPPAPDPKVRLPRQPRAAEDAPPEGRVGLGRRPAPVAAHTPPPPPAEPAAPAHPAQPIPPAEPAAPEPPPRPARRGAPSATDAPSPRPLAPEPGDPTVPPEGGGPFLISATEGGRALSADGRARLVFGSGAVPADTQVLVAPAVGAPNGVVPLSAAYELTAVESETSTHIERFGERPQLTLSYDPSTGLEPAVYHLDPERGPLKLPSFVDREQLTVTAYLPHFSTYVAAAAIVPDDDEDRPPVPEVDVTGNVTRASDGLGVAGASLVAQSDTGFRVKATSGADGSFVLHLSKGSWTVSVTPPPGYSGADSQEIDTTVGTPAAMAFSLASRPVFVSGVVRDAEGAPLSGVLVEASSWGEAGSAQESVTTGVDGTYRLGGVVGNWTIRGADLADYYPESFEPLYTGDTERHSFTEFAVTEDTTKDLVYTLMPRRITGSARDANGQPVPNARFEYYVYSADYDEWFYREDLYTDAAGNYSVRVPADFEEADFYVYDDPAGFTDYDDCCKYVYRPDPDDGADIAMEPFVFETKLGTPVSGTVRDSAGNPVVGVTVEGRFDAPDNCCNYVETRSATDGTYLLLGLAGEWTLRTYDDIAGYSTPKELSLTVAGEGHTGADLVYVPAAILTGTLSKQDTGELLAGAEFSLCDYDCSNVRTNSVGEFQDWLYVDPSTASTTNPSIYFYTSIPGYSRPALGTLAATSGQLVTRDFAYVPFSATVSGTATNSFGEVIAGVVVYVTGARGDQASATTAGDGTWSLVGPVGEGTTVSAADGPGRGAPTPITLTTTAGGNHAGNSLVFAAGRISGTLTESSGAPVAGAVVRGHRCYSWYSWWSGWRVECVDDATTTSGPDGTYTLTINPNPYGYDNRFYRISTGAVDGLKTPPVRDLTSPPAAGAALTGVDLVYARLAVITGRVVDDLGAPLAGVRVALDPGHHYTGPRSAATTDAQGRYSFAVDDPGPTGHSVEPFGHTGYTKLAASEPGSYQAGTVQNGSTLDLADLVLLRNGTVTGTVTDDVGAAVEGANISTTYIAPWVRCVGDYSYYCTNYGHSYNGGTFTYQATSAADGTYSLSAPVTSGVVLRVGQLPAYTTPPDSTPITLTAAGEAAGEQRNFIYSRRAILTGNLTTNSGVLPPVRIRYTATDGYYRCCGTNPHYYSGEITVPSGTTTYQFLVPTGTGTSVRVEAPDFVEGYGWPTTMSYNLGASDLVAGQATTPRDFSYRAFGTITGRVLDLDGQPLPVAVEIFVSVRDRHGNYRGFRAITAADGTYSVAVMEGTAFVQTVTEVPGFGKGGRAEGTSGYYTDLVVASLETISGVDFVYERWVEVRGRLAADTGTLPTTRMSGYSYDRWGNNWYFDVNLPSGGGDFITVRPPGTTTFYAFTDVAGFEEPTGREIQVPTSGPLTGVDFVYTRLGFLSGSLRNVDGAAVGQPFCCWGSHYVDAYVDPDAVISQWVYLDPANPPRQVMVQFNVNGSWEHRAYWGENLIPYGADVTPARVRMGALPALGEWVRLDIPAGLLGLSGHVIGGMAWTIYDGQAWWDRTSIDSAETDEVVWLDDGFRPNDGADGWNDGWVWDTTIVFSGTYSHRSSTRAGDHQHIWYPQPGLSVPGRNARGSVDNRGNYRFELRPGTWRVRAPFVNPYARPDDVAGAVVVAGEATVVNFTYTYAGRAEGMLRTAEGAAVAGVRVCDDLGNCATSDSSGFYTFAVPIGSRTIIPGFSVGFAVPSNLAFTVAQGTVVTANFTYEPNGSVTGVVSDDLGNPLAGATIQFSYFHPSTQGFLHTYQATSGSDGSYSLSVPYGNGRIIVPGQVAGYRGPASVTVEVPTGQAAPVVNFTYDRFGSLRGVLQDSQGGPLAGVEVVLSGRSVLRTTSGADGSYGFSELFPGTWAVSPGNKEGYSTPSGRSVTVPVREEVAVAPFVYARLARISGSVVDDAGTALAGVSLRISGANTYNVITDAVGRFLVYVAPGTYTVTPLNFTGGFGGYTTPSPAADAVVAEAAEVVVGPFTYVRKVRVRTQVVDEAGAPLRGVVIRAYVDGNEVASSTTAFNSTLGLDGVAVFFVPASVNVRIVAFPVTGYDAPVAPDNERTVSGAPGSDITAGPFAYARWGRVEGLVTDDTGAPLEGVLVFTPSGSAFTGADGRYVISVPRGTTTVSHGSVARHVTAATVTVTVASGQASTADFVLLRFGSLTGRAVDETGGAVAGAPLVARQGGVLRGSTTTGADGTFSLDLAPGTYTLVPGDTSTHVPPASLNGLTVSSGQQTPVELGAYLRFGEVDGLVQDSGGQPLRNSNGTPLPVTVTLVVGTVNRSTVTTDAGGAYVLSGPPGDVTLRGSNVSGYDAPDPVLSRIVGGTRTRAPPLVYLRWGRVTGTVANQDGTPLAGVTVRTSTGGSAVTDSAGAYSIPAPRGALTVSLDPVAGHLVPAGRQATVASETDTFVDFTPSSGFPVRAFGTIAGLVSTGPGGTGTPVAGVTIVVSTGETAVSGSDGRWELTLAPRTVVLYPQGKEGFTQPAPRQVTVPAGARSDDVHFQYDPYRTITGRVVTGSGAPVVGPSGERPSLLVFDASRGVWNSAILAADGISFSVLAPPGAVSIVAQGVPGHTTPAAVSVPADSAQSSDVVYLRDGTIVVRLVDDVSGEPMAGVRVGTFLQGTGEARFVTTGSDGTARFVLPVGTYSVFADAVTAYVRPTRVENVEVASEAEQPVELRYRRYGVLTGVVVDDAGSPVTGATVSSYLTADAGTQAVTGADGRFTMLVPPTGSTGGYRLFVLPLPAYQVPGEKTGITVGQQGTGTGTTDVGTFTLTRYGSISGQVRDNVGTPLAGVLVQVYVNGFTVKSVTSGEDGRYTLFLPAGEYRVFGQEVAHHVTPRPNPDPDIDALVLAPGEARTGIDLVYKRYLQVTGKVRDNGNPDGDPATSDGRPLYDPDPRKGPFIAFSGDAPTPQGVIHINIRVKTGPDGTYVAYVPEGNYFVGAVPLPGYDAEPVRQLEVREAGCFLGSDIRVAVDCANYDWVYTRALVQGVVTDDLGAPLAGVRLELKGVTLDGAVYTERTVTTSDGYYTLGGPPGDYAVIGLVHAGYTAPLAPALATLDGTAVSTRDLVYRRNGTVSGRAVDGDGVGLAGIVIEIRNSPDGGKDVARVTTGADGTFTVSAPAGRVEVFPGVKQGYELPANVLVDLAPAGQAATGDLVYVSALVRGRVEDSFGVGLAGVTVAAQDGGGYYNETKTAADGSFAIRVHTGTSFLHFDEIAGLKKPAALPLADLAAGLDPTFRRVVYGNARVGGVLRRSDGVGIGGVTIVALRDGRITATAVTSSDPADLGTYLLSVPVGDVVVVPPLVAGLTTPPPFAANGLLAGQTFARDVTYSINATISGTITDDGRNPLAGVTVLVRREGVSRDALVLGDSAFQAVSGPDGTFSVQAPTGEGITFTIEPGHLAGHTRPAALTGRQAVSGANEVVDLTYLRNGLVTGRVVDSFNNPLAGATLVAHGPNGTVTSAVTAADGTYALGAPVGPITVQALDLVGYRTPERRPLTVEVPLGAVNGIDFTYGNAVVAGQAVDQNGAPLAGVPILIESGLGEIVRTSADGNFRANVAPGVAVRVRPGSIDGYARPGYFESPGVTPGSTIGVPTFTYYRTGTLTGRLVDLLGGPMANVKVFVTGPNNNNRQARTDADGRFTVEAAPGVNTVRPDAVFGYSLPEGQQCSVVSGLGGCDLTFTYGHGVLSGLVRDDRGQPLANVLVQSSGAFLSSTRSDAEGRYRLKVGLGDNTVWVEEIDGLTAPDSLGAPFVAQPGQIAEPIDFTYLRYSTVVGSELKLLVLDADTRQPLAGVAVAISLDGERQIKKVTDANGRVRFKVDPGDYLSYSFKDGFRPVTAGVSSGIGAVENLVLLKKAEFIVGEVTVRRLTLAEILAAGIDVNDPSNQHVYQFTAHIQLNLDEPVPPRPVTLNFNESGMPVGGGGGGGEGGGGGCSAEFGCEIGGEPGQPRIYVKPLPGPPNKKPFAYFVIPGEAKFLKEFFNIHFRVVNTADPEWVLENATAELTALPGLPLAPTARRQEYKIDLGDIAGGQSAEADWIVRGDVTGLYQPGVRLSTTLQPIGEPIEMDFKAREPFKVYGSEAIKMTFDVPPVAVAPFPVDRVPCPPGSPAEERCYSVDKWKPGAANPPELAGPAMPFIVRVTLENQTDFPIYKAGVSLFDLDPAQAGVHGDDRMFTAGIAVAGADDGYGLDVIQRPLLMGFGEQLRYEWVEIAPRQKVSATWTLLPPFGAPVKLEESSVSRTGGNADFKATVTIDPSLQQGISNEDLEIITRGLGQLVVKDEADPLLSWTAVAGARTYRIYRSQDRYHWTREENFLAEVVATAGTNTFRDRTTTGTPGEPQAYFYVIESVFGPNASRPNGESHVLHPVVPIIDTTGAHDRAPLLQAIALPTATVSITGPDGTVFSSAPEGIAGARVERVRLEGPALTAGEYVVTVVPSVPDYFQLTVSGHGSFSDPYQWQHAFRPHVASLVGRLEAGESRSYRILFDPERGVRRMWLVGSGAPRIDSAALDAGTGVVAAELAYSDSRPALVVLGENLDPGASLLLGGRPLTDVEAVAGGLRARLPYGLPVGWHDLLVTNPDGSFGWLYGAVRILEPADLTIDIPSSGLARVVGDTASFVVRTRNHDPAATRVSWRLDGAPARLLDGTTLTLDGLAPGWHELVLELVDHDGRPLGHRVVSTHRFQVLPARVVSGEVVEWPTRPAPAPAALSVSTVDGSTVSLVTSGLAPGTRVAILIDGIDGTVVSLPADGPFTIAGTTGLLPGLHRLRALVVDDHNRPVAGAPSDEVYFWVVASGRRVEMPSHLVFAPQLLPEVPFRLVRSDGMPEYHFTVPAPFEGAGVRDTVAVAVDGVSLAPAAVGDHGQGTVVLPQDLTTGSHSITVAEVVRGLVVTADQDGDGLVNGHPAETDIDGDGVPNSTDPDMDGDGIVNGSDPDVDGDGIVNGLDADVDGDGTRNSRKEFGEDCAATVVVLDDDIDGDGVPNDTDGDDDGDGVADEADADPACVEATRGLGTYNRFDRLDTTLVLTGPGATSLNGFAQPPATAPEALVTYVVQLLDAAGEPVAGRPVRLHLTDPLHSTLGAWIHGVTGADGRASFSLHPAFLATSDWVVRAVFDGDWWHRPAADERLLTVRLPGQPTVHVLPDGAAEEPLQFRIDQRSAFDITGTGWAGDGTVRVVLTCLDCTLAEKSLTFDLPVGSGGAMDGFVHRLQSAFGTKAAVGVWRLVATGTDTNRTFDLVFRVDESPAGLVCTILAAPSAPDLLEADDSGRSASDDVTNLVRPRFRVIAAPNNLVELLRGGAVLGSGRADGDGIVVIRVGSDLTDGLHEVAARVVSGDMTSDLSGSLTVVIDTVAPAVSAPDLDAATDTGRSASDDITGATLLRLVGSTEAGASVVVGGFGRQVGAIVGEGGSWVASFDPGEGRHNLTATATDVAGNTTTSVILVVSVDRSAPARPALGLLAEEDSGLSATDGITNHSTLHLGGVVERFARLILTVTGRPDLTIDTTTGSWASTLAGLGDGTYDLALVALDVAGNPSVTSTLRIVVDTVAPAVPLLDLPGSADSGVSSTDNVTNVTGWVFTGSTENGVTVWIDGSPVTVDAAGNWSRSVGPLADGEHAFGAYATDLAGNRSVGSTLVVRVDTSAPAAPRTSSSASIGGGQARYSGVAEAGSTVRARLSTGSVTVTADEAGNWVLVAAEGEALFLDATDQAGNTSAAVAAPAAEVPLQSAFARMASPRREQLRREFHRWLLPRVLVPHVFFPAPAEVPSLGSAASGAEPLFAAAAASPAPQQASTPKAKGKAKRQPVRCSSRSKAALRRGCSSAKRPAAKAPRRSRPTPKGSRR